MQKPRKTNLEDRKPGMSGKNIIGDKLKRFRLSHVPPLTLESFAELLSRDANLKITKLMLSQIENSKRPVYDYELRDFAQILEIEVKEFF